jgi:hypothetical protein
LKSNGPDVYIVQYNLCLLMFRNKELKKISESSLDLMSNIVQADDIYPVKTYICTNRTLTKKGVQEIEIIFILLKLIFEAVMILNHTSPHTHTTHPPKKKCSALKESTQL